MVPGITSWIRLFLQAVRWKNLLLLALYYGIIRYCFFPDVPGSTYALLLFSVLLIAAGGNLENDLKDIVPDRINRKNNFYHRLQHPLAKWLPYVFYIGGLISAWVFLSRIGRPGFMWYFVAVVILLINYNLVLKKTPLIGNFVISMLTAAVVMQPVFFFDTSPYVSRILILLGTSVFFTNLNREIVKDIADRKGDRLAGFQTLGVISVKTALQTVFAVQLLAAAVLMVLAFHIRPLTGKIYYGLLAAAYLYLLYYVSLRRKNIRTLKNVYKWLQLIGILGILTV